MVAAAAGLFQFVLATIASASAIEVRPTYPVVVLTECFILPRALLTPAPTRFAKSTLGMDGRHLHASSKTNVRLIPYAINNVPSVSTTQRPLSSDSYVDPIGMSATACKSHCRDHEYVPAFDFC